MKRFIILMLLISSSIFSFGQTQEQYLGSPNTTLRVRGTLKIDSLLKFIPRDTLTANKEDGTLVYHLSKTFYFYNGTYWQELGSTSPTGLTYDSLAKLLDVDGTIVPTNGQVLKFNLGTGKWEPGTDNDGGSGSSDGNNFTSSLTYSADTLYTARSGLTTLTTYIPLSTYSTISRLQDSTAVLRLVIADSAAAIRAAFPVLIPSYNTVTQLTDTSYSINRWDGTKDTIFVSLANGDKGDITTFNGWAGMSIDDGAVTNAKIADVAASKITGSLPQSQVTGLVDSVAAKQAKIQFKDEGTNIGVAGTVSTVDFTGAGVTASHVGGVVTVNVDGGGGGGANTFNELKFKVGVTTNAPVAGDSAFTHAPYAAKKINFFREGELQMDSSTTDGYEYNSTTGAFVVHPPFVAGERVIIQAYPTADWTINGFLPPAGYDADAQAYFTNIEGSGGSITTLQKDAISDFVVELKAGSLFTTHFDGIYILSNGSETAVKYNLANPATYTLAFPNGSTFGALGTSGNGTNQYINTTMIMSGLTKAGTSDYHISYYSRTAAAVAGFTYGVRDDIPNSAYGLSRATDNLTYAKQPNTSEASFSDATTGAGFYLSQTRPATAPVAVTRKDGVQKIAASNNGNGLGLPNTYNLLFNAYNNQGTISQFSTRELSIITVGKAFSDAELTIFETAVTNLKTALGW